jgi:hypothetical protein
MMIVVVILFSAIVPIFFIDWDRNEAFGIWIASTIVISILLAVACGIWTAP